MLLFAAATVVQSATDRLREVPHDFWVKLGIGVVALIVVVVVLRKLAGVNKVVLGVVIAVGLSVVGFTWIYERNEPAWATPVVQWLAQFLPTKGKMDPKRP